MRVALTCIAKNEDNYIQEWIDYNFKLGFDDIFIYQNDWRCSVEHDRVHKINFDGHSIQKRAYNSFIQNYYTQYDWVAFLDCDEFLVLKKHKNVKDFIQDYANFDCIGINWVLFGDNGLSFDGNYSVLSRFTKRQSSPNPHIKSILKMNRDAVFSAHNPDNRPVVDTNYKIFYGPFNENGPIDVAQVNHYFGKTRQEWDVKRNRGDACWVGPDHPQYYRNDSDFERHNFNEVEDTLALEFYLS